MGYHPGGFKELTIDAYGSPRWNPKRCKRERMVRSPRGRTLQVDAGFAMQQYFDPGGGGGAGFAVKVGIPTPARLDALIKILVR